jgi:hypothetical protein
MFVDHILQLLRLVVELIVEDRVVNRAGGSLQRDVRVEIEIKLIRRDDIFLDQHARNRIAALIRTILIWEDSDVMALRSDNDSHLAIEVLVVLDVLDHSVDVRRSLPRYVLGPTFRDRIPQLINPRRR